MPSKGEDYCFISKVHLFFSCKAVMAGTFKSGADAEAISGFWFFLFFRHKVSCSLGSPGNLTVH